MQLSSEEQKPVDAFNESGNFFKKIINPNNIVQRGKKVSIDLN